MNHVITTVKRMEGLKSVSVVQVGDDLCLVLGNTFFFWFCWGLINLYCCCELTSCKLIT